MKKKIWSARIKKRYLLVNYIFSISIVVSNETTITVIPKESLWKINHLVPNSDYIYIFSICIVVWNETTIAVASKRKWLLWNEKSSSRFKQRLYFYILFLYSYLSQLFSIWNSDLMDVVELNHMLTVRIAWLQYLSTPNDGRVECATLRYIFLMHIWI